jgi:hypothetical protein
VVSRSIKFISNSPITVTLAEGSICREVERK